MAATVGLGVLLAGVGAAVPASAAQTEQQILCGDHTLTLRTNSSHSSDNGGWSVAQVVSGGSGHLIPTSFTFGVFDKNNGESVGPFTQSKGSGHANQNQQTVSCTQSMTGALKDVLSPGDTVPDGWNLSDTVTFTFTVTAVSKP